MSLSIVKPRSSSHWYKSGTGEPCYEIPKKDGKGMKSPTIADAPKLQIVPSVTTILKVIAAPGLEAWKSNQVLISALTHPLVGVMPAQEMAKIIAEEAAREAELAAERGRHVHAQIEAFFRGEPCDLPEGFAAFADAHGMKAEKIEATFANDEYGGKIDYLGTFDGKRSIVDFKTKSTKGKVIDFYDDWAEQLAAYAYGYESVNIDEENDIPQGVSVVVSVDEPGRIESRTWDDITEHFECFLNALRIWQKRNKWFLRMNGNGK